jgi:Fe-S-cluster containining protein
MKNLLNYRDFVDKVNVLCRKIEAEYYEQMACRKGCDGCCLHFSLFWVEAVNLAAALEELPESRVAQIREQARTASPDGPCPLLENGACILYGVRPIICRTHGFPILTREGDKPAIDFCPRNFRGVDSLPGDAVIDLDRLNTLLAAINAHFVSEFFQGKTPARERLTIAEALLLEFQP